jgi:hypothetical protein
MITPRHVESIAEALAELLGKPTRGDVTFVRCLPSNLVDALIDAPRFAVPEWTVRAVVDAAGERRITADQAVEQREDKADPVLLLIDPLRAGAGLDGIYSAAREIGEGELLGKAQERARRRLWGKGPFLRAAQRRAERLGRRHRVTPWQMLDFLVMAAEESPGAAIAKLGLWPIRSDGDVEDRDLDLAAALSERLLLSHDARSVDDRVRALLLDDPSGEKALALGRFLREAAGRSPLQAMAALVERQDLWLGSIQPRFSGEELQAIRLVSWRGPRGNVARWSGLRDPEEPDGKPRLILDRTAAAKDQARLEVRWTTEPDGLATGTVEYRVSIMAGDEELAEQTVAHRDKSPQKAVFSLEDFDENLDPDAKFEAFVRVAAVAADDVEPDESVEFVLEFGQVAEATTTKNSGQIVRTLADGMIGIASRDSFDAVVKDGHLPPRASEDKKGFISCRLEGGRSVRVQRPALIRQIEDSWREVNGAIGRWLVRVRADGSPVGAPEFRPLERACEAGIWERLAEASRKIAADMGPLGLLARVHGAKWAAASAYINAWLAAFEDAATEITLHGTVEVQSVSGRTLGLIVTPLHPLPRASRGQRPSAICATTRLLNIDFGGGEATVERTLRALGFEFEHAGRTPDWTRDELV